MSVRPIHDVTELLQGWSEGDQAALEKLMSLVYDELHRLAKRYRLRKSEATSFKPPRWSMRPTSDWLIPGR